MKNKISIIKGRTWFYLLNLIFIAFFSLPFFSVNAQETDLKLMVQQLEQRVIKTEEKNTVLERQIFRDTIIYTKTLQKEVVDTQVRNLQEFLKQFPDIYPEGLVTGYFGPLTENAVKRFQLKEFIDSVGIVGPITRAKLNELVKKRETVVVKLPDTGAIGATGITGATGDTGAIGATGATGATGEMGPTGLRGGGATGPIGASGATGATGTAGATGGIGNTGATGSMGATGATGGIGNTGATGSAGIAGATGSIGNTGATGSVGATGVAGIAGATGSMGATGATGGIGNTGATGSAGIAGAMGIAGATGSIGNTGATGSVGSTGASGNIGPTGPTGLTGSTGPTGPAGMTFSAQYVQLGSQPGSIAASQPFTYTTAILTTPGITSVTTAPPGGTVFTLANIGRYEINYQMTYPTDGGIVVYFGQTVPSMLPLSYTMIGKSPDGAVSGSVIIETTTTNSFVSINAAAGNSAAIVIPPNSSTTNQSATTISFKQL
ncbi:MAG: peptidoglycan-binding protein [Candidatus Paceibacterota bacterium]|jgi:hypothetical protein